MPLGEAERSPQGARLQLTRALSSQVQAQAQGHRSLRRHLALNTTSSVVLSLLFNLLIISACSPSKTRGEGSDELTSSQRAAQALLSAQEERFHAPFAEVLREVWREEGVCYAQLKALSERPGGALRRYLAQLEPPLPQGLSREAELAYWLNAYNALMLTRVAELWPLKSVQSALKGAPDFALFKEERYVIGGERRSLDELEHQLIRARFKEPRVHMALNCASRSCPPLRAEPFLSSKLNAQLDEAARAFAQDVSRNELSASPPRLSMLFKWYAEDFKGSGGALMWLAQHSSPERAAQLKRSQAEPLFLSYDWALNSAPAERCARP